MSKTKKVWRCCPVQNSIEEVEVYADTPLDEWVSWYSSECYIYTNDYGSALYYMISSLSGKAYALDIKIRDWKEKKQEYEDKLTDHSSRVLDNL